MKIVQITSDYLPNPLWGMGWHVNQLVNGLQDINEEVYVGTAFKSKGFHENIITTSQEDDNLYLSSNKHEIFNDYHKFNIWQDKLADKILASGIMFDVIHCHNWMSWLTAKKIKIFHKDVAIITTFHFLQKQYELMTENSIPTFHEEIVDIEKDAINNSDRIIVLSDSQERLLLERYVNDRNKIALIPHSVNFKTIEFNLLSEKKEINKYKDIIFVGRIEYDKGIIPTIEAFTKLQYQNARLHVVGDGPILGELKTKYSDSRIIFHGYLEREPLQELLASSHIFCLPSSSENLPLSVLEAMFFGVVPIFTRGNTVPTIFNDKEHGITVDLQLHQGVFVPKVVDIVEAFDLLITNSKMREIMSYQAYTYAHQKYSVKSMVSKILSIYK